MLRLAQPCGSGAYDSMRQHGGWWTCFMTNQITNVKLIASTEVVGSDVREIGNVLIASTVIVIK